MVLMEAQALGTVPVAFDCFSAIGEVINDGVSGIIIRDSDEQKMYEEVATLMKDEGKLMKFKANGLEKVADSNRSLIAKKWVKLFNAIVINARRMTCFLIA
jgi:glycosyltransferase involved in cell wall biosynthesis